MSMMVQSGRFGAGLKVQDVFNVNLWSGTGSNQNISTPFPPDLVWIHCRDAVSNHALYDSSRGAGNWISTDPTTAQQTDFDTLSHFNFSGPGYRLGDNATGAAVNTAGNAFVGWSFKRAPKFFDMVTYTGDGLSGRTVVHALGSSPGLVIIKQLNGSNGWIVQHANRLGYQLYLERTLNEQSDSAGTFFGNGASFISATSTNFTVGTHPGVNGSGSTFIAYLFAHDPAGVIQCGSFTADSSGNAIVSLGWEPQFLLYKSSDGTGPWIILDTTRGWSAGNDAQILANASNAEALANRGQPSSDGFSIANANPGETYIYLTIRKGPM